MRLILLAAFLGLAPSGPATAQGVDSTLSFPAPRSFQHNFKIASTSTSGLTVWYIDPIFVRPNLSFSAAYAYPGASPAAPSQVQISFATGRRGGYDFERSRNLTFLLNQASSLNLGMMEYDVANNMVRLFVPVQTFLRIVSSSSVSGQVGDAAFQLDNGALEAMRDLASRMPLRR